MAATLPQHRGGSSHHLYGHTFDGLYATPAIGTADHAHRRWPWFKFNPFSRTGSAALFASLALCLILICVCSYLARRRAISGARHRFLERVRDIGLVSGRFGRSADEPTIPRDNMPIPSERGACSSSGPAGDCPACLQPLRGAGDVVTGLSAAHACRHVFHGRCIQSWLDQRDSCPVCRCTVSCRGDPSNEAAAAGGTGTRRLRETLVVVNTAARAAGSDDDEIRR